MSFSTEVSTNLKLALPIIAAQLTFMGFGVADTVMAGRLGGQALAAIAVGANIWMQPFVFFMGLAMAISAIVSHRLGAGNAPGSIGTFLRSALGLALLQGLVWMLIVRLAAAPVIQMLALDHSTAQLALDYLLAESWSAPLFCICFALRNTIEGVGVTAAIFVTGLCGLAVKILFNHLLLDEFGAVGFGWSAVIASVVMVAVYLTQYAVWPRLRALQLFERASAVSTAQALEMLRLGLPIGLILLAEVAFFGITSLLMARFGAEAVAAHQIAINFASIMFMVPLGVALATTVRVGHAAGAGAFGAALLRGKTGMGLGLVFALFSAALMGLKPEWITALYIEDGAVAAQAQTFLRFAALFQLADCLQATANGALRGLKDTRMPMLITLTAYWLIGMPFAYSLAFHFGYGPNALWWGFILGLALAGAGLSWRFLHKTKRSLGGPPSPPARRAGTVTGSP
ncbi:MAG: MATE family efflux transporter [Pseudomonadota bacterium]